MRNAPRSFEFVVKQAFPPHFLNAKKAEKVKAELKTTKELGFS